MHSSWAKLTHEMTVIEPSENPSRTLTWKPLAFLRHIKHRTNDDRFSASQWESFISSSETLAFSDVIISVHLLHIRDCWLLLVKPSHVWQCLKELDSTCDRESALWTCVYQTRPTVTSNPVIVGVVCTRIRTRQTCSLQEVQMKVFIRVKRGTYLSALLEVFCIIFPAHQQQCQFRPTQDTNQLGHIDEYVCDNPNLRFRWGWLRCKTGGSKRVSHTGWSGGRGDLKGVGFKCFFYYNG